MAKVVLSYRKWTRHSTLHGTVDIEFQTGVSINWNMTCPRHHCWAMHFTVYSPFIFPFVDSLCMFSFQKFKFCLKNIFCYFCLKWNQNKFFHQNHWQKKTVERTSQLKSGGKRSQMEQNRRSLNKKTKFFLALLEPFKMTLILRIDLFFHLTTFSKIYMWNCIANCWIISF